MEASNILFNLNNVYAVQNVQYNATRDSFDFFYNEEIHDGHTSKPSSHAYIYAKDIKGDFAKNKYRAGHYLQMLFKELDIRRQW